MVNFEKVRLQSMIDHYVYADDLETDRVLQVVWLTGLVLVRQGRLPSNGRFHGDVFDLVHHHLCREILFIFLHVLQNRRQTALMPLVVIFALTLDEITGRLVNRIISKMHV